jgi:hypothetical protein
VQHIADVNLAPSQEALVTCLSVHIDTLFDNLNRSTAALSDHRVALVVRRCVTVGYAWFNAVTRLREGVGTVNLVGLPGAWDDRGVGPGG